MARYLLCGSLCPPIFTFTMRLHLEHLTSIEARPSAKNSFQPQWGTESLSCGTLLVQQTVDVSLSSVSRLAILIELGGVDVCELYQVSQPE